MRATHFRRGRILLCAALALAPLVGSTCLVSASLAGGGGNFFLAVKTEKETVLEARAALAAKDPQKAADLIGAYLTRAVGTSEMEDVYGQALLQLGRRDEAAHHFGVALKLLGDFEAPQKAIKANLTRADPLYTRRAAMMLKIAKDLAADCQKLYDSGHTDRALSILTSLEPIASGATRKTIVELAAKIRAANEEVDLDKGAEDRPDTAQEVLELEGKHYKLESKLDATTTQRVSDVMDDIFNYYVQVYFDGDETRVDKRKASIRIFASHGEMMKQWPGEDRPGLGGWWSPGDWAVSCYDTSSDWGTLDQMLETLYHEASHHFMTMLEKGGGTPSWINEGTASFFEGAKALSDRRVLWPDAADGRLRHLQLQLTGSAPGPNVAQVISYNGAGSYAGDYYPYGWGLIYFLQQYEDPTTLEYVFRPLYASYRDTIARKGGDPMALFKEVFLVPSAPGGIKDFDAWVSRWRNWILNDVYPLHQGLKTRELRLEKAHRYIAAADAAKTNRTAKVSELELLTRALGQLEFVRKKIDGKEKLDADLIVLQADVLERMGRPQGTAALLQEVLEIADDAGESPLEPERYEQLEARLTKLDAKNQPLRQAKTHAKNYAKSALKLLDEYQDSEVPMVLTGYETARLFADALKTEKLLEVAESLRTKARDAGLLRGALYQIGGRASAWVTIFDAVEDNFEPGDFKLAIGGARPVGRIFTGIPVSGEYELRCKLNRVGDVARTSIHGVVFAGSPTSDWYAAGIDGRGQVKLMRYRKGSSEVCIKTLKIEPPDSPIATDEHPEFVVHVYRDDRLSIKVGARAAMEVKLEEQLPRTAHIGVFVKNGRVELESTVLEVIP